MDFLSLTVQEPSQMQANYRRFKLDEVGEAVALAEEHKSFGELVRYARKHVVPVNPDVKLYRSFDRLLADSNIDAVYLPLPITIHAKWAIAAIKAGKHVLCEKPLAANAEQAAQIQSAAQGAGLVVAEALRRGFE